MVVRPMRICTPHTSPLLNLLLASVVGVDVLARFHARREITTAHEQTCHHAMTYPFRFDKTRPFKAVSDISQNVHASVYICSQRRQLGNRVALSYRNQNFSSSNRSGL